MSADDLICKAFVTEANTPSPDEDRELIERLREPDSHDPICPFNLHCYCDDSAPHDNISDDDKIKAADRIESLLSDRAKLEEALLDIRNRVLCPVGPAPTIDALQEIASIALNRSTDRG